ncbi:MAG: RNA polymerase I enhancer binding protein [Sclerophora amabilis]|nr:MAG: RNA polymerase I enhancer binding protein [Sclerophora amabilis]
MTRLRSSARQAGVQMGQQSSQLTEQSDQGKERRARLGVQNARQGGETGIDGMLEPHGDSTGDPSTRSSKKGKTKKSRKKQRRDEAEEEEEEEAVDEHSKEEESARTLLELKGSQALADGFGNDDNNIGAAPQANADDQDHLPMIQTADMGYANHGQSQRKQRKERHNKRSKGSRSKHANSSQAEEADVGAPPDQSFTQEESLMPQQPDIGLDDSYNATQPQENFEDYDQAHSQYPPAPTGQGYAAMPVYGENTATHTSSPYGSNGQYIFSSYEPPPETLTESHEQLRRSANGKRKRRKKDQGTADDDTSATALADAASAANALIDPALTGQDGGNWSMGNGNADDSFTAPVDGDVTGSGAEDYDVENVQGGKRRLASENEGTLSRQTQSRKRSRKSRSKKATDDAPDDDGVTDGNAEGDAQPKMPKDRDIFTDSEIAKLKEFMAEYRAEHDLSKHELNEKIQGNARIKKSIGNFWDLVVEVLPYRDRASVMKVCRRRFHNFPKRGKWTHEEDQRLAVAEMEHPKRWKKIGEIMDRMPEDCRDRWRNYVKCGNKRKTDIWTEPEIESLRQAVKECKDALRDQKRQTGKSNITRRGSFTDEQDEDDLLSWGVISEKMHGARSRLQCMYKWKKIKGAEAKRVEQETRLAERVAAGTADQDEVVDSADLSRKPTWRTKRAEANAAKMLTGDLYHLLHSIKTSGTYEETNIPWRVIGSPAFRKAWTTSDRQVAFRNLKETVPYHEQKTLQDNVAWLLNYIETHQMGLLHQFHEHPPVERKTKRRSSKKAQLSEDVVGPDEDGADTYDHSTFQDVGVIDPALGGHGDAISGPYIMARNHPGLETGLETEVDPEMARQVHLLRHA